VSGDIDPAFLLVGRPARQSGRERPSQPAEPSRIPG
jgi:hypothetical protein